MSVVKATLKHGATTVEIDPIAVRLHKVVPALAYGIPETDENGNVIMDVNGVQATIEIIWIDNFANLVGGRLETIWKTFVTGSVRQVDTLDLEYVGGWTWSILGRVVDFRVEPLETTPGKVRATLTFRAGSY